MPLDADRKGDTPSRAMRSGRAAGALPLLALCALGGRAVAERDLGWMDTSDDFDGFKPLSTIDGLALAVLPLPPPARVPHLCDALPVHGAAGAAGVTYRQVRAQAGLRLPGGTCLGELRRGPYYSSPDLI